MSRKLSIFSSLAAVPWQKSKLNLIDTPGYNLFLHDTKSALRAAHSAVLLLDGVAGVEVSTEKVWRFAEEQNLACVFVVNKLDRERASFEDVCEQIRERFGRGAVRIQLPIGEGPAFTGIVDLIRMHSFCYRPGSLGKGQRGDIPGPLEAAARQHHEELVEMIAEGNDESLNEFFETGTLPCEHIVDGLPQAILDRRIFPILCASGLQNIGADLLADFICETLPAPQPAATPSPSLFVFKLRPIPSPAA